MLLQDTDPDAAHAAATRGLHIDALTSAAASPPVNTCRNIIAQLENPSLDSIATETTWPARPDATGPVITLRYRNQTQIHFRAIPADWETYLQKKHNRPENLSRDERAEILARKPAKIWSAVLPATPDYRYRDEKLPAPRDLTPGFYFIAASLDETFSDDNNILAWTPVWVSTLAIVCDNTRNGRIAGYVVDAVTGEPVANVTVRAWHSTRTGERTPLASALTDADGSFEFADAGASPREYRNHVLLATAPDGQAVATGEPFHIGQPLDPPRADNRIFFFTDRSIYRPGQTIQFKAVLLRINSERDSGKPLSNRRVTVVLDDPNGKEAARAELRTNDYGSITGSFTVPVGRLTGHYRLYTTNKSEGGTFLRVEEYKRPKFEVALPPPAPAPKLNDTVTLTGAATAYTGAPIDGAKVAWRVRRLVRWPAWCWWFRPTATDREIAHGTAVTAADGKFAITFAALPDKAADPENEPVFDYAVTAEVTDTAGETRTASRVVSVGYTALRADVTVEGDWLTEQAPVTFKLKTATLDDAPQSATGTLAIHALQQPRAVPQPLLDDEHRVYSYTRARNIALNTGKPAPDVNSPDSQDWPVESTPAATQTFTTAAATGLAELTVTLPAGIYRAIVTTTDRFGKPVTAQIDIRVLAPDAKTHPIKEALSLAASAWTAQPGETLTALWSAGYETARALVSIEQNQKVLRRFWTNPGVTQQKIPIAITESMRGGITLRVFQVRDNRLVSRTQNIAVPWDNKRLKIAWEHFNSKLVPGGRETWTAKITGPDATRAAAELTATLYDVSLDQFYPHTWSDLAGIFRQNHGYASWTATNELRPFSCKVSNTPLLHTPAGANPTRRRWGDIFNYWTPRYLVLYQNGEDIVVLSAFSVSAAPAARRQKVAAPALSAPSQVTLGGAVVASDSFDGIDKTGANAGEYSKQMPGVSLDFAQPGAASAPDLSTVTARKNLQETAFFFPQLLADADGSVRIEFTVPEALTRWKFLGFAHDKKLRSAVLADTAATAKDLMVQPNPPRFLREGDTVEFTVKLTNMTDAPQRGTARLTFADATTLEPVTLSSGGTAPVSSGLGFAALGTTDTTAGVPPATRSFTLPAHSSTTLSWRITVPDGQGFLTYKAVASATSVNAATSSTTSADATSSTATVSDGEEGFLPVLSRRRLVTESIALPIRDAGTRTFRFDKLAATSADATLRNESLTVQMTSNPAWYAVLALPMLMEFPHECSEQLFNRYYANALAAHIANSDPKIARVFEQWRNTPATDSPLLKNEDLKSILIEETPWLRAATRESERRRALALLFDTNRAAAQTDSLLRTLDERQLADGLWSWFPGGNGSDYITRYLVAGFARLRHFGIPLDRRADAMLERALSALDARLAERHAKLLAQKNFDPEARHLDPADVFQLYTRSFFAKQIPVPADARAAYDFFAAQTRAHWPRLPRQSQGHAALALARSEDSDTALAIVASLRQRAKTDPELGMWWADTDRGWFWWQAPIETQALMIEVFDEVARAPQAVADLQLWLLKQKQTQAWPSTKATADAVYALLLRGADKLASDALVTVTLGDDSNVTESSGTAPSGTTPGGTGAPPVDRSAGIPARDIADKHVRAPENVMSAPPASETQHDRPARATQPSRAPRPARAIAQAEPGTGYYSERIPGALVTPAMGEKITVTKTDAGPAWGSVTWQYFQSIDKITPHEGTPLTLKKSIWKQTRTAAGPTLVPLTAATLNPGDTLVVRLELRTDRDMEFVHLKDQRGSGTEPVNVLSGHRWRNGLGYYESTRDTAAHFFIDRLPRGTHVFEYPIRVQLRGAYESGLAEIQCMYAPEYNSHSASTALTVE
ncbi:MAG: hypothetical protein LBI02_02765 [Opitutaceae bacterium]|nr:hypothetical protein [Opitutaceae bacterium]